MSYETFRQASWLELFFDLVFVASAGVLTSQVSILKASVDYFEIFKVFLVFTPLWWIWASTTIHANKFKVDPKTCSLLYFLLMTIIILMIPTFKKIEDVSFPFFIILYALTRIVLASLYLKSGIDKDKCLELVKFICLSSIIALISICFKGEVKILIFYISLFIEIAIHVYFSGTNREHKIHIKHLAERVGLLTIILLGESLLAIVLGINEITSWNTRSVITTISGLAIMGSVWWIYFDKYDVFNDFKSEISENLIVYPNYIVCLGLMLIASMIRNSIIGRVQFVSFKYFAVFGLFLFLFGQQLPYILLFEKLRFSMILNLVFCILVSFTCFFIDSSQLFLIPIMLSMLLYIFINSRFVSTKILVNS